MKKQLYRVREFCECYSISKAGFYRQVFAGRIRIIKCGRTTYISHAEAQRWVKNLCRKPKVMRRKKAKPICCRKKRFSLGGLFSLFISTGK